MELWVLRVLHISSGAFWAGTAMFMGFFLIPAIVEAGPGGGAVMNGVMKRKFQVAINAAAFICALSGVRLYMLSFSGAWLATGTGIAYSLGAVFAVGSLVISVGFTKPVSTRMSALADTIAAGGLPPTPEQISAMQGFGARLKKLGKVNAFHLLGAALSMAAGRYFPMA